MTSRSVHLPLFGLRKNQVTTNELIFRILARKYPLPIAGLRDFLAEEYRQRLSYQAVRKAVFALHSAGIVERRDASGYQLSADWMLRVRGLIDDTLRRYRSTKGATFDGSDRHQLFIGDSLYETDTLWGDIVISLCRTVTRKEHKKFISINRYPWWIPMNVGHEIEFCRSLKKLSFKPLYVFTVDTPSARWAAEFYRNIGVQVHICKKCSIPSTHYYNVIGDSVIEVILPDALERKVEQLFGRGKHPKKIPPKALSQLASQPGEIRLSVQTSTAFGLGLLKSVGLA